MKISCFDYDDCLDGLRRLMIEGKSDLEFDSNIWTDRSYENRANRVKGLKDCIRWTMSIMSKEPTDIKDLIKLTKKGIKNSFLVRLDENENVNPIDFLKKYGICYKVLETPTQLLVFQVGKTELMMSYWPHIIKMEVLLNS